MSPDSPQNIATAIAEVSERASVLVHEEIELAKAEVTEKMTKLVKGAIVGAAAGVFFLLALIFALIGCAWLLYFYLPVNDFAYFWGFFGMAVILIVFGVLAGLIAARAVKRSSPPVPTMAIAEAQKIREAVSAPASRPATAVAAGVSDSAGSASSHSSPGARVTTEPPPPVAPVAQPVVVEPIADPGLGAAPGVPGAQEPVNPPATGEEG